MTLPASAQQPLRPASVAHPCVPPAGTAASDQAAGQAIVATVTHVDPRQGTLEFTTDTGAFVLTTPTEMPDLRVGDLLWLCLHEEESEGENRVAEDGPAAIPRAP